MKELDLIRVAYAPFGTFGKFVCNSNLLYTVERPWLANQHNVSCIPEGDYLCKPKFFTHGGGYPAVEVLDVPNRSDILFHIANWPENVKGCIGVGNELGVLANKWAVLDSSQAFKAFMDFYGKEPFRLRIRQINGAHVIIGY